MRNNIFISVLMFMLLCCDLYAANGSKVGVVLLHGKWGSPSRHINQLATAMSNRGYMVITPVMPWSKEKGYDTDYPAALGIVDHAVQELRKKGATVVVLAGHSMGANASIAYAANGHEKIDAIIAIAPGHTPDLPKYHMNIESSLYKANEMISAGKGDERTSFIDLNGGVSAGITMTAAVYFSYNDSSGMAAMPISASKVTRKIPLFWIVAGPGDVLYNFGQAYVFDKWPPHPLNKYLVLNSTHLKAPDDAESEILQWIDTVALSVMHTRSALFSLLLMGKSNVDSACCHDVTGLPGINNYHGWSLPEILTVQHYDRRQLKAVRQLVSGKQVSFSANLGWRSRFLSGGHRS